MHSQVTDWELTLILFASIFTIFLVLFIVSKWLNFHFFSCCLCGARNRKNSTDYDLPQESSVQEPVPTFTDLEAITQTPNCRHNSSLWTHAVGSISSLVTNDTTCDDIPMPNSTSAFDIVSYANNTKSTLKRTITCDSDNESIATSFDELHLNDGHVHSGKLQITINFNALEENLEIFFIQARDLVVLESEKENLRTFIVAWLDDDRRQIQQSQLILYQKGQATIYNALMKWQVDDSRLPCTVLHTIVYSQLSNDTEIIVGECTFTIGEIYIYQPLTTWLNLHDNDEISCYSGEVSVSLCYHPTAGRLTCSLIQARNLIFHQRKSFNTSCAISSECYATISLLHRHQIIKKTRTSYHYATDNNPIFNEMSVFNLSSNDLLHSFIRIVIYEVLSSSSTTTTSTGKTFEIGHCLIGNYDHSQHMSHWQQMLRVLRRPVIVWHALKL